jgi:hypothetical protein
MLMVFWMVPIAAGVCAELRLESASRGLEALGQDPQVTLKGGGLDGLTTTSTVPDVEGIEAIIGSVDTLGTAKGVKVTGDTVYVADNDGGLAIVSLPTSEDKKGDIDGDGNVDLADAILALQVVVGSEPELPVRAHKDADVNGDGRIGLEEAIYVTHKVAGARQ